MLIIDDNAANRELYVDLLEMTSFTAFALDSGDQAVALVQELCPGLVLLDIQLPGRDGFAVAADIRAAATSAHPAPTILALTASSLPGLAERLEAAGFAGLVSKPCGLDTFIEAVEWAIAAAEKPKFRVF